MTMPRYPERIETAKRRGRPKVEERLEVVSCRLPADTYDRLIRAANLQEMSVSRLVRKLLILRIPKP